MEQESSTGGTGPSVQERVEASAQTLRHGPSTERTVFFSDAVFAIAMTLLVLDLRVDLPDSADVAAVNEALLDKVPAFAGFVLSFALVATTWLTHHRRFRGIAAYDSRLQTINMVLLFLVAFLPVPTSLLFEHGVSPLPIVLYAVTIAGIFVSLNWLWRYARHAGLMDPSVSAALYRYTLASITPVWVVFVLSVPVAFVSPTLALYSWLLISPASIVSGRLTRRRFERDETARFAAADAAALPAPDPS